MTRLISLLSRYHKRIPIEKEQFFQFALACPGSFTYFDFIRSNMLFKNNVLQDLASSSTALFLANMIIATFVQVAIENTAPALENTDSPDVPGNDSRERVEADAGKLAHSLSPLPRDTSLLYIWGLLTPAKDYAAKSNLSTIWNVYEGHYYPPDSHTDAERQKFYRILACGYIDTCWGIVWPMVSST